MNMLPYLKYASDPIIALACKKKILKDVFNFLCDSDRFWDALSEYITQFYTARQVFIPFAFLCLCMCMHVIYGLG